MKRLTLLIDADDTVLDFANSERDSIIALCREYSILSEEKVAEKFKQINRRMWDMFERGEITREPAAIVQFPRRKNCSNIFPSRDWTR